LSVYAVTRIMSPRNNFALNKGEPDGQGRHNCDRNDRCAEKGLL
jgi:hypothetical protein